jgi:hypothetical protein
MVQTSLIWGLIPFIFSGFTSSAQSQTQQEQLRDIRVGQIERNIRDAVELRCYAQIQGNMPALSFATEAIRKYQTDYVKLTNRYAQEPSCDALIVTKR